MLTKKEITNIIIVTLILAFAINFMNTFQVFLYTLGTVFLIIMINLLSKKITSFYLDTEIETKLWEIKQYGFKAHQQFKRPFPAGAFFPIITTFLSFGHIPWMASLIFDVKGKVYRAAKRHGLYSFSGIAEDHIGLIAAAGIFANLVFAVIGYFIGLPKEMNFVELSILYAFFNMLPISDLDGNKIFFGNLILWSFLASVTLAGLIYTIFII